MTLENTVMNFKYKMEATGSIDGAVDLMKEVRNSGSDNSVKLIRMISDSVKRVVNIKTQILQLFPDYVYFLYNYELEQSH